MTLVTRQQDGPETSLSINWLDFEDDDLFLDQVDIPWVSRDAEVFRTDGEATRLWRMMHATYGHEVAGGQQAASTHGTLLRLAGLRSAWTEILAKDVERALSRLVSPAAALADAEDDFTIVLDLPAPLTAIGGVIGPPEELRRPHYRLDATVDGDGRTSLRIRLRDGDDAEQEVLHLSGRNGGPPRCGPFALHVLAWDRDRQALEEVAAPGARYTEVRQVLDRAAGISVYRDGFRVLPYGESGNDWLELDKRRINDPSRRLSNNQVIGTVSIARDRNPDLFDQTNREGLVAGGALDDFRDIVLELLALLERRRVDARPKPGKRSKDAPSVLEPLRLTDLREAAAARADSALTVLVDQAETEIEGRTEQVREVVARYQRLATLGQLVDKMVHEVGQPAAAIRASAVAAIERIEDARRTALVQPCEEVLTAVTEELQVVRTQARAALDILRRLAPFGGRKRGRPQTINLEQAIAETVNLLRTDIERTKTTVDLPQTSNQVTVDGTELQEIVLNLLTNSLYWVTRGPRGTDRRVAVDVERNPDASLAITVSDSGPGVPEADRDRIFDPYFTTRAGGFGLGLALAGEIVSEYYGGELELVTPGLLGGATFRATLRRRVG